MGASFGQGPPRPRLEGTVGVSVSGLRGRATLTVLVLFLELARLACQTLQRL